MKQKGLVSLEYVLIFAGVLSVIMLLSVSMVSLYNKNLNEIDNNRLKEKCKEINNTLELLELMPQAKKEIELNNLFSWNFEKTNKQLLLKNKQKECKLFTSLNLIYPQTLNEKHTLIFLKQNNDLNIS